MLTWSRQLPAVMVSPLVKKVDGLARVEWTRPHRSHPLGDDQLALDTRSHMSSLPLCVPDPNLDLIKILFHYPYFLAFMNIEIIWE